MDDHHPPRLTKYRFPPVENADKHGLLSIGGPLNPERVLAAYHQGVFPWFEPDSPTLWWSPNPRLILYPDRLKAHRSLKRARKKPYQLRVDSAFENVIQRCATVDERIHNTWITDDMRETYNQLHVSGYAHSFEIWREDRLVGGLYGISLGNAFFGESMFHIDTDASKIALYELCTYAKQKNISFIDCQLPNPFLQKLGAQLITREAFMHILHQALQVQTAKGNWSLAPDCDN